MAVLPVCSCSRASSVHSARIDRRQILLGRLLPSASIAWPELTPGAGVAVDRRRRVHVVAHDQHRPADCRAPWRSVPSGTISPLVVADLELLEVLDLLAEVCVGLHVDLPGAAEAVEVVDVERAEVDLQRVEHLVHRHAHRLGLACGRCRGTARACWRGSW